MEQIEKRPIFEGKFSYDPNSGQVQLAMPPEAVTLPLQELGFALEKLTRQVWLELGAQQQLQVLEQTKRND